LTSKKDAGDITLTDKEIRGVVKILSNVGLLILHEDDTFSKHKNFDIRKRELLEYLDSSS
ncbi:unnamed protein product, partial [marine sediment metagenome]